MFENLTNPSQPITADDIRNMKHADRLIFQTYESKTSIRSIYDQRTDKRGRVTPECEAETPADACIESYKTPAGENDKFRGASCHIWMYPNHSMQSPHVAQVETFINSLRAGDVMRAEFKREFGRGLASRWLD